MPGYLQRQPNPYVVLLYIQTPPYRSCFYFFSFSRHAQLSIHHSTRSRASCEILIQSGGIYPGFQARLQKVLHCKKSTEALSQGCWPAPKSPSENCRLKMPGNNASQPKWRLKQLKSWMVAPGKVMWPLMRGGS